jgi:hypothetical protein
MRTKSAKAGARVLRTAAVGILLVGLTSCGSESITVPDVGMHVTVTLSSDADVLGDTVTVDVEAANVSGGPLSLDFLGDCQLYFEVLDQGGNVVAPDPHACPIISFLPMLAAGDSIGIDFKWTGERTIGSGTFLPAGTYRVRGVLDTQSGPVPSDPETLTLIAPTK